VGNQFFGWHVTEPTFAIPAAACRRWLAADFTVAPLPGGLSGAAAWTVDHGGRRFVLKSCASAASREHVAWVHSFMRHVREAGVAAVPMVERSRDGDTLYADPGGALWELLEWKPGCPVSHPSAEQAVAAADVLARVHRAAAAWPACPRRIDHSPGVLHRVARARALLARPWATRLAAAGHSPLRDRFEQASEIVAAPVGQRAVARIAAWRSQPVALQPVLRDVWSDHVLFVGGEVTGIIDWHAAGMDTPATDLARLVGSWGGEVDMLRTFLDAYAAFRPLSVDEAALVGFLRDTGILLGLDNWLRWIVEESRQFADTRNVEDRVDALLVALPAAVERLAAGISTELGDGA
jgi:Ser/Thr protein kinase RdoA (MazF antagonist)